MSFAERPLEPFASSFDERDRELSRLMKEIADIPVYMHPLTYA